MIGLVQEWATIGDVIQPSYKEAIGFLVLILVLLVRPQGIFGQTRAI
jgi:branched-subunit amino acid ABC-type transport system permease component